MLCHNFRTDSLLFSRHVSFQFFEPIPDYGDLADFPIIVSGFQDREALAVVGRLTVVGNGRQPRRSDSTCGLPAETARLQGGTIRSPMSS